ncbi:MAG: 50S ribosomal protein L32 [Acidobacteriota bacterium]|nr:50S ribosomal protein L32 [Acidobacteriota bacterium]
MAVPKRKQSHSRTAKRRAQHKVPAPALATCPRCSAPRRAHRVCPVCGTYDGRQVLTVAGAQAAHDHDHDHDHDH